MAQSYGWNLQRLQHSRNEMNQRYCFILVFCDICKTQYVFYVSSHTGRAKFNSFKCLLLEIFITTKGSCFLCECSLVLSLVICLTAELEYQLQLNTSAIWLIIAVCNWRSTSLYLMLFKMHVERIYLQSCTHQITLDWIAHISSTPLKRLPILITDHWAWS